MHNPTPTKEDYISLAKESRLKVLDLVYKAQTSHIGSLLGAADVFSMLFSKMDLDKDRFVLSAGWKAALLYFHLWKKGRISLEELDSYCQPESKWIGLTEPIHPDILFAGGSMGYGLPAAVGFALAKKMRGEEGNVYCYMSDGELAIGTTWESALIAAQHNLNNLVLIVERNGYQAMGPTNLILDIREPDRVWLGMGWMTLTVNGHDPEKMAKELDASERLSLRPRVFFMKTTKGKGASFMENNNLYHYKNLSEEEYKKARAEINI